MQLSAIERVEKFKDTLIRHEDFNASDIFSEFDKNNDGYVTAEEFNAGVAKWGIENFDSA